MAGFERGVGLLDENRFAPRRIEQLGSLTETPVVLVCRTDKRSQQAAAILRNNGVREVMVLRGGMEEWTRQVAPLSR